MSRRVVLVSLVLLGSPMSVGAGPVQEEQLAQTKSPKGKLSGVNILVGQLTRQYTVRCVDGKDVWGEPSHLEIGFVHLVPPPGATSVLEGKVVVARGRAVDGSVPARKPFENHSCNIMQMRSDWILSKDGIRRHTDRYGALVGVSVFAADTLKAVSSPEIVMPKSVLSKDPSKVDNATVRFVNPLDKALTELRIEGRYEGCYGKPGQSTKEVSVRSLAPGAQTSVELPVLLWDKQRSHSYRLASVRFMTETPGVAMDLDYGVPAGQGAGCPE